MLPIRIKIRTLFSRGASRYYIGLDQAENKIKLTLLKNRIIFVRNSLFKVVSVKRLNKTVYELSALVIRSKGK